MPPFQHRHEGSRCDFNMPEKSAETLRAGGWLRRGDLATLAERGCCRIVGRLKDSIIARRESLPRRDRSGLLPPSGRRRGGGRRPARRAPGEAPRRTSPGIIFTPLAKDELTGPRGEGYRRLIELSPMGRGGTPDEVGAVGALLMGPDGTFTHRQRLPHGR
jgi:hypothetical protein